MEDVDQGKYTRVVIEQSAGRQQAKTHRTASAVNPSPSASATVAHAGFTVVDSMMVMSNLSSLACVQPPILLLRRRVDLGLLVRNDLMYDVVGRVSLEDCVKKEIERADLEWI